jgi:hypothetical protein
VLPEVWADAGVQAALGAGDFGRVCALVREISGLREMGAPRLTNIDKIIILLDGLGTPATLTGPMLRSSTAEPDDDLGRQNDADEAARRRASPG